MSRLLTTLLLGMLLLAPATAQEPEIDAIVASRLEPGEPTDQVWDADVATLERDHPAVARAIANPDFVQQVSDSEEASTRAFFDRMNERGATAVRVDGELYSVGITIGQSNLPPGDGNAPAGTDDGRDSPAAPVALLAIALIALAIAARKA
ncbi:MAG TPA: hypothetical protein VFH47_04060 [Candidatus Thermoplasmatota archaeon]|nr:hypothetical protein [Candidatus Thermoplasmatota archaeon]